MSTTRKVVFTEQFPNGDYKEIIPKPIGEAWEMNYDIGWPLYQNHTYSPIIDKLKYKINDRRCRGVCFCSNDRCGKFKQYMTGPSGVTKRKTASCDECNHILTLKECPVKVRFTHNITLNMFKMEHFGEHPHDQCSNYKRRKLNTSSINYPLNLSLNYQNSCFIDAPVEMLFNSVFPFLTFSISRLKESPYDEMLGSTYRLYHNKDHQKGRQFAMESIRNHIRLHSDFQGSSFGSADFVLTYFLQQVSDEIKDAFTIHDMLIDSTCTDNHRISTKKNFGPIITASTPYRYFYGPSKGNSCKHFIEGAIRCGKSTFDVKTFNQQPLPRFLIFSKTDNHTSNTEPYRYEITLKQTLYTIHSIIYLKIESTGDHFYTITKIQDKNNTFLAKIDNLQPAMSILTTDPTLFYHYFYDIPVNHHDVIICYKQN